MVRIHRLQVVPQQPEMMIQGAIYFGKTTYFAKIRLKDSYYAWK